MQDTSLLYRQIIADPDHYFEVAVAIGEPGDLVTERGETILFGGTAILIARSGPDAGYQSSQIFSLKTSSQMFGNDPEIGKAIAQEIELQMLQPAGDIPPMAQVVPYVRACTETQQSEWLQQGVFYIDTRETTASYDGLQVLTIHGFDAMLKTEQDYDGTSLNWPATDIAIVREIASKIGVTVDPRTVALMTGGYRYPLPTGYTLREMLCYIATAYVGSFIMTETGQLRLVTLLELPAETNYLIDQIGDAITFGIDRQGSEVTVSGGAIASFETEGVCDISELTATIVPKQDLHGYDAPWAGGAGKNLINQDGTNTDNGYVHKSYINTSGTISQADGNWDVMEYVPVEPSTTYTLSGTTANNVNGYAEYNASKTRVGNGVVNTSPFTFTTGINTRYVRFNRNYSTDTQVQLEKGSTATAYQPYANECPITGWTGATVSNTQNLISFEQGGIQDADGIEVVNAGRIRSGYIPIENIPKARNILTLLQADSVDIRKRYFYWYDANHTYIHEGNGTFNQAFPITLQRSAIPSGAKYLRIVLQNANNSLPVLPDGYNVSINPATASVTWQDEAGTVYGATVDFASGQMTATHGIIDLGTLSYTYQATYERFYAIVSNMKSYTHPRSVAFLCSCFEVISDKREIDQVPYGAIYNGTGININIKIQGITDATVFKNYVTGQTLVYELATPQTYQLTPQQLKTFAEQNNIFVDTGSIEEVKYLIPTSEVTRILV